MPPVWKARTEMKRPHLVILGAWLVHAAAWFLPVTKDGVTLPDGLPGWQAFRVAFTAVWPYETFNFDTWYTAVLATASAVTTLLFLFGSPWVVWRGVAVSIARVRVGGRRRLRPERVLVFSLLVRPVRASGSGPSFWWLSFVFLAIGTVRSGRTRRKTDESRERPLAHPKLILARFCNAHVARYLAT